MNLDLDFYATLRKLLDQIPEDKVTTYRILGEALGDPVVSRVIGSVLSREDFQKFRSRVVRIEKDNFIFSDFESDTLLKKLMDEQTRMATKVIHEDAGIIRRIAGVDVAYSNDEAYAVCAVVDDSIKVVEKSSSVIKTRFPYIPGYLAYREAPAVISAVSKCSDFDVLLINGHGIAHPRECGLATFVGLQLNMPTIGVARRILVGSIGKRKGDWAPILKEGKIVGAELWKNNKSPIYVSTGNRICIETVIRVIRGLQIRSNIPEPLRLAHKEAEKLKKRVQRSTLNVI